MKRAKYIFLPLLFTFLLSCKDTTYHRSNFYNGEHESTSEIVYICTGSSSECYHNTKSCRGLRRCSKTIKEVTKEEAEDKYHRRACGYCY